MRTVLLIFVAAALLLVSGCAMPNPEVLIATNEPKLEAEGIEALEVGSPAPEFRLPASDGEPVELDPESAEQPIVLFFFPAPDTPNSTLHLRQLSKDSDLLAAAGVVIYGITTAPQSELDEYASTHDLVVPLISDPGGELSQQFGTLAPGGQYPQRTLVAIDEAGEIALYERRNLPVATILERLGAAVPQ